MDDLTDALLLAKWRSGDREAFAVLVSRYHGLVQAACRRQAAPGEDDDCVQAVFLVLARRPAAASRAPVLAAWLQRTAWFVCEHARRAARRRRQSEGAAAVRPDHHPAPQPEALDHLDRCLLQLPEKQRTAVTLHYLAGKTPDEVAASLSTNRDHAYLLISRGLAGLRVLLARRGMAMTGTALAGLLASEAQAATAPAPLALNLALSGTPTAGALATGAANAMIITAITPLACAAALVFALGGLSLGLSAEPAPVPVVPVAQVAPAVPVPAASAPEPGVATPGVATPSWATASGQDSFGIWADLQIVGLTQRMRWIRPGSFIMGSSAAEKALAVATTFNAKPEWFANEIQHEVTLTHGFWLADTACTQQLWQALMGSNPSQFHDSPQNPVEQVSWDDCQLFLSQLNAALPGGSFGLPSEAQWEYACRAGTTTAFSFGPTVTTEQVNFNGRIPFGGGPTTTMRKHQVPVKTLPPNPWGLYEMHGNLNQWCSDRYGELSSANVRDPLGPAISSGRVYRGGSWDFSSVVCRSAYRLGVRQDFRAYRIGFRFAAGIDPKANTPGGTPRDTQSIMQRGAEEEPLLTRPPF